MENVIFTLAGFRSPFRCVFRSAGSFMDHLTFCRDYCAAHYPGVSSTPYVHRESVAALEHFLTAACDYRLFIHSIMGVGTNIFPMGEY